MGDPWLEEMSSGVLLTHAEDEGRNVAHLAATRDAAEFVNALCRPALLQRRRRRAAVAGKGGGAPTPPEPDLRELTFARALLLEINSHTLHDPASQQAIGEGHYPSAAAINHSCWPNSDYLSDAAGRLRVVTVRPVAQGEEITIAYTPTLTQPTAQRCATLRRDFFFACDCPRCEAGSGWDAFLAAATGAGEGEAAAGAELRQALTRAEAASSAKAALPWYRKAVGSTSVAHTKHGCRSRIKSAKPL